MHIMQFTMSESIFVLTPKEKKTILSELALNLGPLASQITALTS